jgi:putative glutamine amidotransferase
MAMRRSSPDDAHGHVAPAVDDAPPVIGVSPRLLRNMPVEAGFRGRTLQYLDPAVAAWVMRGNAVAVMIPSTTEEELEPDAPGSARQFATRLDGLVLQGGADIHPGCYGQAVEHSGVTDEVRDRFELSLLRAFVAAGKPVLGVCRGMQLINVLYGGTLHQDLQQAGVTRASHVLPGTWDGHHHELLLEPGGWLGGLHPGLDGARVNSIHHQGVDRLGEGLVVEARAADGVVEAIRHVGEPFVVGLQWHPEFHGAQAPGLLSPDPVMSAFLDAARRARARGVRA